MSPRFGAGTSRHSSYAAAAAAMARSASAREDFAKYPITSSVLAGFRFSNTSPEAASTACPLITFRKIGRSAWIVVMARVPLVAPSDIIARRAVV